MEKKEWAAAWAFIAGVFCFVLLVAVGGITGSPDFGWTMVSLASFAAAMGICWNHPGNVWFTGILLNATLWLQVLVALAPEDVVEHLGVLLLPLLSSYLGALIGGIHPLRLWKRRT
jgi:branched-subunit amino acid permease